jgi:hypothetical protein
MSAHDRAAQIHLTAATATAAATAAAAAAACSGLVGRAVATRHR